LFIKVGLLHHVGLVAFKRPLLCFLDGLIYFGPAFVHHRFSASCMNWVDSLTRWSLVTPRFQVTVRDSITCVWLSDVSWLSPRSLYGITPEILNRIHILRLGG